jgi:hypothetical protein
MQTPYAKPYCDYVNYKEPHRGEAIGVLNRIQGQLQGGY